MRPIAVMCDAPHIPKLCICCSPMVSEKIFTAGNTFSNRLGKRSGLISLGMCDQGIIWNNDLDKWQQFRKYFAKGIALCTAVGFVFHPCLQSCTPPGAACHPPLNVDICCLQLSRKELPSPRSYKRPWRFALQLSTSQDNSSSETCLQVGPSCRFRTYLLLLWQQ